MPRRQPPPTSSEAAAYPKYDGAIATESTSHSDQGTPGDHGQLIAQISNAMVRLYKQHFGKGPTRVRAYYQGDVVTCVLRDGLTRADRTLIDSGHADSVVAHRYKLQQAVRNDFITTIAELTGREVIGFFSGTQPEPEIEVEVFVLAPRDGDDQSSNDRRAPD